MGHDLLYGYFDSFPKHGTWSTVGYFDSFPKHGTWPTLRVLWQFSETWDMTYCTGTLTVFRNMGFITHHTFLTLILLTWWIWWVSNNASRWQFGFNSAPKGLKWFCEGPWCVRSACSRTLISEIPVQFQPDHYLVYGGERASWPGFAAKTCLLFSVSSHKYYRLIYTALTFWRRNYFFLF